MREMRGTAFSAIMHGRLGFFRPCLPATPARTLHPPTSRSRVSIHVSACPPSTDQRFVHPLLPWRPVAGGWTGNVHAAVAGRRTSAAPEGAGSVVVRRPISLSAAWRRSGEASFMLDFGGLAAPGVRSVLLAWLELGRLTPPHLQALLDEVAAAEVGRRGGAQIEDLAAFAQVLGSGAQATLDDPMSGIVTGALHRALVGSDRGLFELCDHLSRLSAADGMTAAEGYVELLLQARSTLVALALRLAARLPDDVVAEVQTALREEVDLFSWWRERSTIEVLVLDADGRQVTARLPVATPPRLAVAVGAQFGELAALTARLAARVDLPGGQRSGVVAALAEELHDGSLGLIVNGLAGAATPAAASLAQQLVPRGWTPTRASWCRALTVGGVPFRDALQRFFAVPHTVLPLRHTGREIVLWRLGLCPFPDFASLAAVADEGHPAWLPAAP